MRSYWLSALLLACAAAPLAAQPRPLSLADAVAIAERRNPALRAAANDEGVAAAEARQAWGAYLPQVSANLDFAGSYSRRVTTFDPFGNAIRQDPVEVQTSSAGQSLSAQYTIFDGFRREQALRAARAEERAAASRAGAARVRLAASVARAYYQALGAAHGLAIEQAVLAAARDQLAATERRFAVAGARREDVLGAQEAILSAEGQVARARGEAEKALLLLREVLGGGDGEGDWTLVDSLPTVHDTLAATDESLVALALDASPELRERAAAAEASARRSAAARGQWWPSVQLGASYGRSLSDRMNNALFELDPPDQTFSLRLGASLPLFDQFRRPAETQRAAAQAEDAREQLREVRLRVEREVRAAAVDLRNAELRVRLAERASALSRERVQLSEERYRTGGMGLPELQQVLDRAAAAERNAIAARVEYAAALATLREKVGGTLPR